MKVVRPPGLISFGLILVALGSVSGLAGSHRYRVAGARDLAADDLDWKRVPAPVDQEVCFSPDEPCAAKLTQFIAGARSSLDIAIYDINLDALVHQILFKKSRVAVRILVDQRQAKGAHSLVPLLVRAGVAVRYGRQRGIMHNKFAIVDGKQVEVGSFNYTHHATRANNENQFYVSTPAVVRRYRERFERIWKEGRPADAGN